MARQSKSEKEGGTPNATYKLVDKHRFLLHLIARQKGLTYTQILEKALDGMAHEADRVLGKSWLEYFDPEVSMRTLNAIASPGFQAVPHEQQIHAFTRAHPTFFWDNKEMTRPRRAFVVVLWPNLARYMKSWATGRDKNYWVAAEAMAADLKKAQLTPPKFG